MESTTIDSARQTAVGFVGLGMMGMPMAKNILESGRRLIVCDMVAEKVEALVSMGAEAAESPGEIAAHAGVLICMVETSAQAEAVILGNGGFVQAARPGDLVILMSTIEWTVVKKIHTFLVEKKIGFIDAPVAGMRDNGGARTASLKCFVGGEPCDLERARPVLEAMASEFIHWGEAGNGTVFKLLNSMVLQANRIVAAEALALGAKAGLDPEQMLVNFSRGYATSGAMDYLGPRVLARDFDGIRMGITIKDVELQIALGKALEMPMLMTSQGQHVYHMARAMGLGDEDGAAVIKVYENWTGVPVIAKK
jgi:3-hydroxyisobutyrate dehydrogenase-like beta-hydroxyacid dehydrogenase